MDLFGELGRRRLDQAVVPTRRLVEPVAEVADVVVLTLLDVALMCLSQGGGGQAGDMTVSIQICRHRFSRTRLTGAERKYWAERERRCRMTAKSFVVLL